MRQHKYNARQTVVDGITFPSRKQANRYQELMLLLKAGEIMNLELEKTIPLIVNGQLICKYRCDFVYIKLPWHSTGSVVYEDVKGYATNEYRLKKKLMKAIYNIEILET